MKRFLALIAAVALGGCADAGSPDEYAQSASVDAPTADADAQLDAPDADLDAQDSAIADAETSLEDAKVVLTDAEGDLASAETALVDAEEVFDSEKSDSAEPNEVFDSVGSDLIDANEVFEVADSGLSETNEVFDSVESDLIDSTDILNNGDGVLVDAVADSSDATAEIAGEDADATADGIAVGDMDASPDVGLCAACTVDDGNPCTSDSCDPAKGCVHTPVSDGTACMSGAVCVVAETCTAGVCGGGKEKLFEKVFPSAYGGVARGVIVTQDRFVTVGTQNPGQMSVLNNYDFSGVPQEVQNKPGPGLPLAIVPADNGGFVALGQNTGLQGFNAAGKLVWQTKPTAGLNDTALAIAPTAGGGYVLSGITSSGTPQQSDAILIRVDPTGALLWEKAFGTNADEWADGVAQAGDNSLAFGGLRKVNGDYHSWLVRTDADGTELGQTTFDAITTDSSHSLAAMTDGYLVGGTVKSAATVDFWISKCDLNGTMLWEKTFTGSTYAHVLGFAIGEDGSAIAAGFSSIDGANGTAWIQKVAGNGDLVWNRTYASATAYGAAPVGNSGFIVVGSKGSGTGTSQWLLRLDPFGNSTCPTSGPCAALPASGCDDGNPCTADLCDAAHGGCFHSNLADGTACTSGAACVVAETCSAGVCTGGKDALWEKTYGDAGNEGAFAAVAPANGGLTLGGGTTSKGAGKSDFWLLRVDESGKTAWDQTYGGTDGEEIHALLATADSGYLLLGPTASFGAGNADFWLVRTNASGDKLWDQTYGGSDEDEPFALLELNDGGLALFGSTASQGAGSKDGWMVLTDLAGKKKADYTFGNTKWEVFWNAVLVSDGIVASGYAADLDPGPVGADFWLVKTNASGQKLWDKTYDGGGDDAPGGLIALADGFLLAGYKSPAGNYDAWIVRTDSSGNELWSRSYGGPLHDIAWNAAALTDGFVLTGGNVSKGAGGEGGWIMRTDVLGNVLWDRVANAPNAEFRTAAIVGSRIVAGGWTASSKSGLTDAFLTTLDLFGNPTCPTSGPCASKPADGCDDANPCTADLCSAAQSGCFHTALPDGVTCTTGKTCSSGACK